MKLINRITIRISISKFLQNRYCCHLTKSLIDLDLRRFDVLKQSLEKKKFSSAITHENNAIQVNSVENIKTSEICSLTSFNEEEFLWKLRLGLLIKRDSDNYWNILQVYMANSKQKQQSLSMQDIERIFIKFFLEDQLIKQNDQDLSKSILFWQLLQKSNILLSSNCYNIILQNSASSEYLTNNVKNIFKEMRDLEYAPTITTLQKMMKDYGRLGKIKYVKKCYQLFLKLGYKPTRNTYNYLINANILIENFGAINYYLRQMVKLKFKPSKIHVDKFIKDCALNDRFESVQWAFEKFYVTGDWNPTSETYDWILLSCSKRRQRKVATNYFNEMVEKKNLRPSALTFQYLIMSRIGPDGLGFPNSSNSSEVLKEATDLYKSMKQEFMLNSTMFTCFIMIRSLIDHDKNDKNVKLKLPLTYTNILPELSNELLDKLRFNANPAISKKVDNGFLRHLFSILLKYEYLEAARNVYRTMRIRKYKFAIETGSMDLIESYAKKGDHISASQIFREMIANGIRPQQYHYDLLLKGYFQTNDYKEGMEFYKSMESHKLIPSREIYHTMIQALVDIKDVQQARETYQELINYHGISNPDTLKVSLDLNP